MPTFTKTEKNAFATLGEAIVSAKESAKDKKDTLPLVKAAIAENREASCRALSKVLSGKNKKS